MSHVSLCNFFSVFRCPVVEAHTLLMKLHSFSFPFMVVMGTECRVHTWAFCVHCSICFLFYGTPFVQCGCTIETENLFTADIFISYKGTLRSIAINISFCNSKVIILHFIHHFHILPSRFITLTLFLKLLLTMIY